MSEIYYKREIEQALRIASDSLSNIAAILIKAGNNHDAEMVDAASESFQRALRVSLRLGDKDEVVDRPF